MNIRACLTIHTHKVSHFNSLCGKFPARASAHIGIEKHLCRGTFYQVNFIYMQKIEEIDLKVLLQGKDFYHLKINGRSCEVSTSEGEAILHCLQVIQLLVNNTTYSNTVII